MRRFNLLAAIAALALVLAPTLADAAAGRGSSMGSRGSRTYSAPPTTNTAPGTAAPMQRSTTQPGSPAGAPGMAAPAQPSRGIFGGMMGGFMGGLLGAGLIGMLFGGGFFSGMGSFMGIIGMVLQIMLVVFLVRMAIGFFRRRSQPVMAGGPAMQAQPQDMGMMQRTGMGAMPMGASSAP